MTSEGSHSADGITGIVLCGGEGRRVAGADKPLLNYRGRPLIEWVLETIKPQVDRLLISTNRNDENYATYAPVISDELPAYSGPLAGIVTCLKCCTTELAFICPGDVPHLPAAIVAKMLQAYRESGEEIAVAHDGVQRQNLHLLLARNTTGSLLSYLAEGHRSVHGWLDGLNLVEVDFSHETSSFRNLNDPDDFR